MSGQSAALTRDKEEPKVTTRRKILPVSCAIIVLSILLMLWMMSAQPALIEAAERNQLLFPFAPDWIVGMNEGNLFYRVMWYIGDWTNGIFVTSIPASVAMLATTFAGYVLEKKKSKYAGTGVGGNSKVFLRLLLVQLLASALCMVVYSPLLKNGFVPTLAPMFSVAPAVVTTFGFEPKKCLTAIAAGGLIPFPIAYFIMKYITDPLGLPGFCGVALGMALGVVLASELCRLLPWMKKEAETPDAPSGDVPPPVGDNTLFLRRLFADSNEIIFWGSSWGGVGMIVGGIVSWVLNPLHPFYSSGNYPILLCVMTCTTALAVLVYFPWYRERGFAFTFSSLLLVCSIVNTYPCVWQILVPTILVSLALPFLIDWALGAIKYDGRWHVCCVIQAMVGVSTIFWSFFIMNVLIPLLGL